MIQTKKRVLEVQLLSAWKALMLVEIAMKPLVVPWPERQHARSVVETIASRARRLVPAVGLPVILQSPDIKTVARERSCEASDEAR